MNSKQNNKYSKLKKNKFYKLCVIVFMSLFIVFVIADSKKNKVKINKLYICIHPYCWSAHKGIPEGQDPKLWNAYLARELRIHELHMKLVSNMKQDEALIILPIGNSKPMERLIDHAKKTLGGRCYIEYFGAINPDFLSAIQDSFHNNRPKKGAKVRTPIQIFLEDKELKGRKEFIQHYITNNGTRKPDWDLAKEIENEIQNACKEVGCNWRIEALKVVYYTRVIAENIKRAFKENSIVYNPNTLKGVAFGEGFELCAFTWKAMLPYYLGMSNPFENDFELSVANAPFLITAKLIERISFPNNVRLFLWREEDGRSVCLFYRAASRLKDPQLYAYIPMDNYNLDNLELRGPSNEKWSYSYKPRHYQSSLYVDKKNRLRVQVLAGTRKGGQDYICYLIDNESSYEEFRKRLLSAQISTNLNPEVSIIGGEWYMLD